MKVFYRIYPGRPDNRPFADGDKKALVLTCFRSFLISCRRVEAFRWPLRLYILLDGCPDWQREIRQILISYPASCIATHEIVDLDGVGNKPSFLKQLDLALEGPDDELVYFAEDDYLYRPMAVAKMLSFIPYADFITLYDHPDRYTRGDDRYRKDHIEMCDGWHWRTIESTTMTFGTERRMIKAVSDVIRKHACEGRNMWYPILDRGYRLLWGPIPSLATHVQNGVLAPCIDWEAEWKRVSAG